MQSGQGADEVLGGYDWYPPLLDATGLGDEAYAAAFFDRTHAELVELLGARLPPRRGPEPRVRPRALLARRAATARSSRALRLDTEVMLVDDPVKRVDNMTMAWGLECRTPFLDHEFVELAARVPGRAEARAGRQGRAQGRRARRAAGRGHRPPKGYFPVPALKELQGPYIELVRDALLSGAARERGMFDAAVVERLLARPNADMTNLGGNVLWQLGVLELWLQAHGV